MQARMGLGAGLRDKAWGAREALHPQRRSVPMKTMSAGDTARVRSSSFKDVAAVNALAAALGTRKNASLTAR
jgi:hypothetical protein